jgi:enoyl-CoA hydratase/carnithine racemase
MKTPLHPGMTAILRARLPVQTCHEMIVTGRRYGGDEALRAGIVDHAVGEGQVVPMAIELAASLADKAHPVMGRLKAERYPEVLEALRARLTRA